MKKYKITYYNRDSSKPRYLIQISKSGKADGVRVWFWEYEEKFCQDNWKNGLRNGIFKYRWSNSKNWYFRNWKKNKSQGIQIDFEK